MNLTRRTFLKNVATAFAVTAVAVINVPATASELPQIAPVTPGEPERCMGLYFEKSDNWYRVEVPNGRQIWLPSRFRQYNG